MKKRFGIDIDGTVTCPSTFVPYINKSFNKNITLDDITQFDLTALLNISQEEFWNWMNEYESTIYAESPLAAYAKENIISWEKQHELYYISARRDYLLEVTYDWFNKNKVPYHHIELVGKHDKIETVKKHDIDIFFEDKHDNACDISEACDIPVILFNTPYNQDPVPKNVVRVNDWNEAKAWVGRWL